MGKHKHKKKKKSFVKNNEEPFPFNRLNGTDEKNLKTESYSKRMLRILEQRQLEENEEEEDEE